jgi:hypothetical protein
MLRVRIKEVAGFEWFRGKKYNKALIDPARSGAIEIVERSKRHCNKSFR